MKITSPLVTCTLIAIGAGASGASAQTLAYDGFSNGPLADLGGSTGGSGWAGAWTSAGDDQTQVGGAGLQYPGLATLAGAAVTPVAGGIWPNSVYTRAFPSLPAGTDALYVSFLMRDDAAWGSWGGISFGQYPYEVTVGSPLGYYSYGLMVSEGLGDVSAKPLVQGETTLVVVKISKNAPGTGVTYRMFLDPAIGSSEPSFPDALFGLGPLSLPTFVSIDNGTGFTTDELRVGTTWASVLPAAVSPWIDLGFAKPGIGGAPHLVGSGPLTPGSRASVALSSASPLSPALLGIGTEALYLPLLGGVLVPSPLIAVAGSTSAAGTAEFLGTWPAGTPAGAPVIFQYWIQDPAATFGYSASNGLKGVGQ